MILGKIAEEEMGFVKKENEFGLFRIAHFGQVFEERGEQPQQKRGVDLRRLVELIGGKNVDDAMALRIGLQQIVEIQSRFAEKFLRALLLEGEQSALNRADAGGGDVAVLRLKILGVIADVLQHGLQVLQIQQQ